MATKRPILFTLLLFALLGAILLIAVVGVATWLVLPSRDNEPVYKGKPLSVWLKGYDLETKTFPESPEEQQADEAVQHIGTNAIPTLLRMLRKKDPPADVKIIMSLVKRSYDILAASRNNNRAADAFRNLGPSASNAVPALIEIYGQNISEMSKWSTSDASGYIGPAAEKAIPSLLIGAAGTNNFVRASAINALGRIHGRPELLVPFLIKCLSDSQPDIQESAAGALGNYGPQAKPAVPALLNLVNNPNPNVRLSARISLKHIDPIAAANAGIK